MHLELSGGGPPLHFGHANGFPLLSYQHFLQDLYSDFSIFGLQQRALWPGDAGPPARWGWYDHAADLIEFLDRRGGEPVIGMGHSMGGTISLLAAAQRPDLFRALVLIDPAAATDAMALASRWLPKRLMYLAPFIGKTVERLAQWPDVAAARAYFSTRQTWSVFTETALDEFLEHALVPADAGGVKLAFSPAWEAHNYASIVSMWPPLRAVDVPTLVLRGSHSYVQTDAVWRQLQRKAPQHRFITIDDAGHLLPQEVPARTLDQITGWMREQNLL